MPLHLAPQLRLPRPDQRAFLDTMPGTTVPVIRQPFEMGDTLPFWAYGGLKNENLLYDRQSDPQQLQNLASAQGQLISPLESELLEHMKQALVEINAPQDLMQRLGLL